MVISRLDLRLGNTGRTPPRIGEEMNHPPSEPTALRDRVCGTRRLNQARGAMAISAAALIAVGMSGCASPTTAGAAAPAASFGASPTPSVSVSSLPVSPVSSSAPASTAPAGFTGTTYYVVVTAKATELHELVGRTNRVVFSLSDARGCSGNSMQISPDGTRIAWLAGVGEPTETTGGLAGDLVIANVDGSRRRDIGKVMDDDCNGGRIAWTSNTALAVASLMTGSASDVDVVSGKITGKDPQGLAAVHAHSPNGQFVGAAVTSPPGGPTSGSVSAADGSSKRTFHYKMTPEDSGWDVWQVTGVSNDGAYVAVGSAGEDEGRACGSFAVIDVATSRAAHLPVPGSPLLVSFVTNGDITVTSSTKESWGTAWHYSLLDSSLHLIATESLPVVWGGCYLAYIP